METTLEYIAKNDFKNLKAFIESKDFNEHELERAVGSNGLTLLAFAAYRGKFEIFCLLSSKLTVHAPSGDLKRTPLHFAAARGHANIVENLLDHGADVNVGDRMGATALSLAVNANRQSVVKTLLEGGASVDGLVLCPAYGAELEESELRRRSYGTPLIMATKNEHVEIIELLIKYYPEMTLSDGLGMTALHHAATIGNVQIIDILIEHRAAYMTMTDVHGRTALHHAAMNGQTEAVKYLLTSMESKKLNLDPVDRYLERTPFLLAALNGSESTFQAFLSALRPINFGACDKEGRNALHLTVERGHKVASNIIENFGNYIDVKATDRNGKNALDIAKYELYQCAAEDTKGTSDKMKFYLNIIEELKKKLG